MPSNENHVHEKGCVTGTVTCPNRMHDEFLLLPGEDGDRLLALIREQTDADLSAEIAAERGRAGL